MVPLIQFALVLHLVIETTACMNFFLRPSSTLSTPQPYSHGVIRQYALLLVTVNIIVAIFLSRAVWDPVAAQVAAAVAFYHVGPLVRAVARIRRGENGGGMGGPWLHAVSHAVCGGSLVLSALMLW